MVLCRWGRVGGTAGVSAGLNEGFTGRLSCSIEASRAVDGDPAAVVSTAYPIPSVPLREIQKLLLQTP